MSTVSIVIPIYNVEAYLDECLESVEAQTMSDWEAVCVNDGSTDSSPQILARHAAEDGRIRVVNKANGGLSSARNAGLDAVRGDYVCFLDSDDRLAPDACRRVEQVMGESGADVLTYGADTIPFGVDDPWLNDVLNPRDVTYDGFSCDILFKEKSRPYAWRTALSAEFLRRTGVRFDETLRYGEDQVFDFAIYPRARRTQLISDHLYEYRVARSGSLMDGMLKDRASLLESHVQIMAHVFDDWDSLGILNRYMPEMLGWSVEFVLYDALKLGPDDARKVGAIMVGELRRHWSGDMMRSAQVDPTIAAIVGNALDGSPKVGRAGEPLMMRYYVHRYGKRAFLSRMFTEFRH